MAQKLKEDLREKIERAAIDIMVNKGIESCDMRSIAKGAGCTTGNLYRYYDSKDRLILSLIKPLTDRLNDIIARRTGGSITLSSGREQLKIDSRGMDPARFIRFLLQDRLYGVLIALGDEARKHPKRMKILINAHSIGDSLIEWTVGTVTAVFYACMDTPVRYREYVNTLIRVFTQSFCQGVMQLLIANETLTRQEYRRLVDRFMNMQLSGICAVVEDEMKRQTIKPNAEVFNG